MDDSNYKTEEQVKQIVTELNGHFKNYGTEILSFSIINIHLPTELQEKIAKEKQLQDTENGKNTQQDKNKQYLENLDKQIEGQ